MELLSVDELAKRLTVSKSLANKWRVCGGRGGPPFIKIGHAVRYDWDAVQEWLKAQTRQSSDTGKAA